MVWDVWQPFIGVLYHSLRFMVKLGKELDSENMRARMGLVGAKGDEDVMMGDGGQ